MPVDCGAFHAADGALLIPVVAVHEAKRSVLVPGGAVNETRRRVLVPISAVYETDETLLIPGSAVHEAEITVPMLGSALLKLIVQGYIVLCSFKGTVSRDFSCLVFFIKQLLLVSIGKSRNDFEFFRIFVELFVFVIESPVMNTPGSRLESHSLGIFANINRISPRS